MREGIGEGEDWVWVSNVCVCVYCMYDRMGVGDAQKARMASGNASSCIIFEDIVGCVASVPVVSASEAKGD